LPVALALGPLERRSRPANAPVPSATRLVAGAILICLGVAVLALIGFGNSPLPFLDIASFAMVVLGAAISGLLPARNRASG